MCADENSKFIEYSRRGPSSLLGVASHGMPSTRVQKEKTNHHTNIATKKEWRFAIKSRSRRSDSIRSMLTTIQRAFMTFFAFYENSHRNWNGNNGAKFCFVLLSVACRRRRRYRSTTTRMSQSVASGRTIKAIWFKMDVRQVHRWRRAFAAPHFKLISSFQWSEAKSCDRFDGEMRKPTDCSPRAEVH